MKICWKDVVIGLLSVLVVVGVGWIVITQVVDGQVKQLDCSIANVSGNATCCWVGPVSACADDCREFANNTDYIGYWSGTHWEGDNTSVCGVLEGLA